MLVYTAIVENLALGSIILAMHTAKGKNIAMIFEEAIHVAE
jgi:hypothetical protein